MTPNACAGSSAKSSPGGGGDRSGIHIGVEAADALRRNGLRVTVLERAENVLLRDRPVLHRGRCASNWKEHGVELRCGVKASAIEPEKRGECRLRSGGGRGRVQAQHELATEAGVEIGRTGAIRADDHMETNLHGVLPPPATAPRSSTW